MPSHSQSGSSRNEAPNFLLEEYRGFADAFWRNEATGETRVNWFITIVTAAAGGLGALATAERGPRGETLRLIILAVLAGLTLLGTVTVARMLKRNRTTDRYKRGMDSKRRVFRERLDGDAILAAYPNPFMRHKGTRRKLGGLAYIVASIDCVLLAAIAGTISYPFSEVAQHPGHGGSARLAVVYVISLAVLVTAALAHLFWLHAHEHHGHEQHGERDLHTHAGGIVYRINEGWAEYLLVGPKKDEPNVWLFPKGHIERGEGPRTAAMWEVLEETGTVARILRKVGASTYTLDAEQVNVVFFLMRGVSKQLPSESRRQEWFAFDRALELLTHEANRKLLCKAEKARAQQDRAIARKERPQRLRPPV